MTYQWLNQSAACPVVEFHDIRTEKFKSDRYSSLVERRMTGWAQRKTDMAMA